MKKRVLTAIATLCCIVATEAKVTLPSVIASDAVLQQNDNVKLWGEATPNAKLTVQPSWTKQKYTTKVDADGTWELDVKTIEAGGGPYTITFDDGEKTTIDNILLGEVWLCFGQSNMRMMMKGNGAQPIAGITEAIFNADEDIPVRYFKGDFQHSFTPLSNLKGNWHTNNATSIPNLGATPYFFALRMQSVLRVPIGIVECARGGSCIEAWMSEDMLKEYRADFEFRADKTEKIERPQHEPAMLFNGVLEPIKNLRFKGALWYQGEANVADRDGYHDLFKIFVEGLRNDFFDCGEFPLYYAQITPYLDDTKAGNNTLMRETIATMVDKVPNTGLVVLSDLGEKDCIHPRKKKEVGDRFAYYALGDTYGYKMMGYRAPEYSSMKQVAATDKLPKRVALTFNHAPLGLCFKDEHSSSVNFEVAGKDKVFHPATVRIGWGKNHIEVWSDKVKDIVAVRYGFRDFFIGDVYNSYGIPISSFRTDDWAIEVEK